MKRFARVLAPYCTGLKPPKATVLMRGQVECEICWLASWGIATQRIEERRKAPIIPAQPSGLGNRTGEAKALKARSISVPGITLVEFGPMSWRQQSSVFLETPQNGLLARCGTSILRSMISEIGSRRWRLGLFLGTLTWGVARALPQAAMDRAVGPRHSKRRTHQASAREKWPSSRHGPDAHATTPGALRPPQFPLPQQVPRV